MDTETSRILVVDDNEDIRDLIVHILTAHGFQVFEASNGQNALEMLPSIRPHLVLLDVMMPGLSGYDVVEKIRSHEDSEIAATLIVMITAKSQVADVELAMASGASDYLIKPFRQSTLMEKVAFILKQQPNPLERSL